MGQFFLFSVGGGDGGVPPKMFSYEACEYCVIFHRSLMVVVTGVTTGVRLVSYFGRAIFMWISFDVLVMSNLPPTLCPSCVVGCARP